MHYISKKNIQGKQVVILENDGLPIQDAIDVLLDRGWSCDILRVSYSNDSGGRSTRDVPVDMAMRIQEQYHFVHWDFRFSNGIKTIAGSSDERRGLVFVTSSKNHALRDILSLPTGNEYFNDTSDVTVQMPPVDNGVQSAAPASKTSQFVKNDSDYQNSQSSMRESPDVVRKASKRHSLYIILAILEIIFGCLAPSVFAIFAIDDTVKGRKLARQQNYMEANNRFKEARICLIGGLIAGIIMMGIIVWKYYPIVQTIIERITAML